MKLVHCRNCRWTHFEVDAQYVKGWEDQWKVLAATAEPEYLAAYGLSPGRIPDKHDEYGKCFRCRGSYRDFEDGSTLTSSGHTIQGILARGEEFL